MTLKEFYTVLASTNLPVTYLAFPADQCPTMPFITYQETGSNNFGADGKVYQRVRTMQVDLFTKKKDPASEDKLETALDAAGIFWQKMQTIDDNESCQRYTYEVEIIGG